MVGIQLVHLPLAVYEKCSTNKLLEEAIQDLLKKYGERPTK
jgi:hypothetical protein